MAETSAPRARGKTAESPAGAKAGGTVDAEEVRRFGKMADGWWDPNGVMKPLHAMNPTRLSFIRAQAIRISSSTRRRSGRWRG